MIRRRVDIVERAKRIRDREFNDISPVTKDLAHAHVSVKRERRGPEALVKDDRRRSAAPPHRDHGRGAGLVATGDKLRVGAHAKRLKVIRFGPPEDFYRRLGEKLGWGRPLVPLK